MSDVRIDSEEYLLLKERSRQLNELRAEVERHAQAYDHLSGERAIEGRFFGIIRTLDGWECFCTDRQIQHYVHSNVTTHGRREILMLEDMQKPGFDDLQRVLAPRRLRRYVETARRIRGIAVWQEIHPDADQIDIVAIAEAR